MLGIDPMKVALDGAKKKMLKVDLDHNGKPDVLELKQEIESLEGEVAEAEKLSKLIDKLKAEPAVVKEVSDFMHKNFPITMSRPEAKNVLDGANHLAALQPRIMDVVERAGAIAQALGVDL